MSKDRDQYEGLPEREPGIVIHLNTPPPTAEEQLLHEAILAIFDDSSPDKPKFFFEGTKIPRASGGFDVVSEDTANAERLAFSRAVIKKWQQYKTTDGLPQFDPATHVVTLQSLADLCERHRGKLLPAPAKVMCDECLREQTEEVRC